MPSPPTTPAQRYLDVLRTLGVTDGTIRRQHGVAPEASLQATLEAELEAPTDELLDLLAASGVVVDLGAVVPVDADRLAMSLARFGFVVECSAVGDDMEIVGFDAVAEDVEHLRVEPEREALRSALVDRLLGPAGVEAVSLVDDRTLVADGRALAVLRERYGPRVEPFDTPLLAADVERELSVTPAITAGHDAPAAVLESPESSTGPRTPSAQRAAGAEPVPVADAEPAPRADADADDAVPEIVADAESVDEALETADDGTAAAIEDALADSGPAVHTADGTEDDVEAVRESGIGGGPRRTVSATGIDEVFAQLEDEAAAESRADRTEESDTMADHDPFTTPVESDDEQHDAVADASHGDRAESDDADGLAGGGPKRTVAETSADDILERVGGGTDFDDIANEEAEADPDAVLSDADDVPDVDETASDGAEAASNGGEVASDADADGSAKPATSAGDGLAADGEPEPSTDGGSDTVTTTSSSELDVEDVAATLASASDGGDAEEHSRASDTDATDVADASSGSDESAGSESTGSDEASGESDGGDSVAVEDAHDSDDSGIDDEPAPQASNDGAGDSEGGAGDSDADERADPAVESPANSKSSESADGRPDLGDDLLGDDVEVRKGDEEIEIDPATLADRDPDPTDGPLAAAGGVAPVASDDGSDGEAPADSAVEDAAAGADGVAAEADGGSSGFLARVKSVFGR